MSVPKATVTELDGQLGIVPVNAGNLACIVADAESGPLNTPAVFSRTEDVLSAFTGGPLVERACRHLKAPGSPGYVVCVRSDRTTDGAASSVTFTGTGTSVVTVDTDPVAPWDAFEVVVEVLLGGIIGTGPITLRYSLDGGRVWSKKVSLGTANTYTIPLSGVVLNFAAGDLDTGDTIEFTTTAPKWNATDLAESLAAVQASSQPIEYVHVGGACSGTEKDTIIAAATASHTAGKHRWFTCETRTPAASEADSAYQTSLIADFLNHKAVDVEVVAGACRMLSSVPNRPAWNLRVPAGVAVAPVYASVEPHIDIARTDLKALPGVQIKDSNGNPVEDFHDEDATPGLDDAGFTTLRSHPGESGVFVNNPRIQSADGSDFIFVQYRRVMNILRTALQAYLRTRLSLDVRVQTHGPKAGFILESDAREIELGANAALWRASKEGRYISGGPTDERFTLTRNDPILQTQTLTYDARAVPLGYVKEISGALGFSNPARGVAA